MEAMNSITASRTGRVPTHTLQYRAAAQWFANHGASMVLKRNSFAGAGCSQTALIG
ncbi:hypothetical protein I551_9167 [Mycobacterium ulcerans str. Harvey]|uniref:Uncharacterized protein n=1 Tax=Mycobacterium ulcerans str. Harvey TaxID=1299332 RepID=A0ABP3ARD6_MYCUL|nr:hypothetical protein I551_9167 [Mycobacterium ulcerans str. Harvey]